MPRIHALLSMICKNNKIYADYAFFKETQMQSSNPAISVIRKNAGVYNFGGTEAGATISGTTTKSIVLVALTLNHKHLTPVFQKSNKRLDAIGMIAVIIGY